MNKNSALVLVSACLMFASQSNAMDQYVALGIGSAKYTNAMLAGNAYPNPVSLDIAYGYRLFPQFAVEFGCTQFGNSFLEGNVQGVATKGNISANSTHAAAVGFAPIGQSIEAFGKVGLTYNIGQLNLTQSNSSTVLGASGTNLYYGIGASYKLNATTALKIQYENLGSFGQFVSVGNDLTATVTSLGLVYSW